MLFCSNVITAEQILTEDKKTFCRYINASNVIYKSNQEKITYKVPIYPGKGRDITYEELESQSTSPPNHYLLNNICYNTKQGKELELLNDILKFYQKQMNADLDIKKPTAIVTEDNEYILFFDFSFQKLAYLTFTLTNSNSAYYSAGRLDPKRLKFKKGPSVIYLGISLESESDYKICLRDKSCEI